MARLAYSVPSAGATALRWRERILDQQDRVRRGGGGDFGLRLGPPARRAHGVHGTIGIFAMTFPIEQNSGGSTRERAAGDYLAEKSIGIPKRRWRGPGDELLAGDARWVGGLLGMACGVLAGRMRTPSMIHTAAKVAAGGVYVCFVGNVGFVYAWPRLWPVQYWRWEAATEAKEMEKEAKTWAAGVEASTSRYRLRKEVEGCKLPLDLKSPLLGYSADTLPPRYVLEEPLRYPETLKAPAVREIKRGVGPNYVAE